MANNMIGYEKSLIEVNIQFDTEREREFKSILGRQFGCQQGLTDEEKAEDEDRIHHLEADFIKRASELRKFRKNSQVAYKAPILTQALVKRTKNRLSKSEVSSFELTPLQRFRLISKMIIIFVTLSQKWKRYHINLRDEMKGLDGVKSSYSKYLKAAMNQTEKHSESKKSTKSKYRVADELQEALRALPENRGEEDLMKIQKFCRNIGALSNFPVERELDVARHICFESYDKGRVLCLQGRKPDRFYYILSGRVRKIKSIELISGIKKQYFGELHQGNTTDPNGLLLRHPRECSLVCKNNVELLLIEHTDFINLLKTSSSLDNSNACFIRSLDMFQTFPLDSAGNETMTTKYFPKDTVIVKDISESPHFYIIKSGTCKLLQKHVIDKRGVPIIKREHFPKINRGSVSLSFTTESTDENGTLSEAKALHNDVSTFLSGSDKWMEKKENLETKTKEVEIDKNNSKKSIRVTQARLSRPGRKVKKHREAIPTLGELICGQKQTSDSIKNESFELKLPLITLNNSLVQNANGEQSFRKEARLSTQFSEQCPVIRKAERGEEDAYLQIGVLKRGDIYGLDSLMRRVASIVQSVVTLPVNPSITERIDLVVISEGAECILVDKKLFLKAADFGTLSRIVTMHESHTSVDDARVQIETSNNWGSYKKKLVKDIVQRARNNRNVSS